MSAERPSNVAKEGHVYAVDRPLGCNRPRLPGCRPLRNKLAVPRYEAGDPLVSLLLSVTDIMGLPEN